MGTTMGALHTSGVYSSTATQNICKGYVVHVKGGDILKPLLQIGQRRQAAKKYIIHSKLNPQSIAIDF